jgi:hypothetical protein
LYELPRAENLPQKIPIVNNVDVFFNGEIEDVGSKCHLV